MLSGSECQGSITRTSADDPDPFFAPAPFRLVSRSAMPIGTEMEEDGDNRGRDYGPETSLGDLTAGVQAGSAAAWNEVLNRFERLVFSVAYREGLSVEDSADVTQTAFEELLKQLDQIRDEQRISWWLITVARRQAWRVKAERRRQVPDDMVVQFVDQDATDPITDHMTLLWTMDGLSQLDRRCRDLLISLYFDPGQPSYAEVAARMERPVGSIGPTRARCLQRLRSILGDDGWS